MAFEIIHSKGSGGHASSGLDGVCFVGVGSKNSNREKTSVRVSVGRPQWKALGWAKGDNVDALRGTGADNGYIAIRKDRAGCRRLYQSGKSVTLSFSLSVRAARISCPTKSAALPYRIEGDTLIVDCRSLIPTEQSEQRQAA